MQTTGLARRPRVRLPDNRTELVRSRTVPALHRDRRGGVAIDMCTSKNDAPRLYPGTMAPEKSRAHTSRPPSTALDNEKDSAN